MKSIDLNADLAEDVAPGRAAELIGLITSANIACGGHAGSPDAMRSACELAAAAGVAVGAHPGYADRENFGRLELGLRPQEISEQLLEQLSALAGAAAEAGVPVTHVKPHGALYHRVLVDADAREALLCAVAAIAPSAAVLGPPDRRLESTVTAAGHEFVAEGFADRGYRADGSLIPRGETGSVLTADGVAAQALALAGIEAPTAGVPAGLVRTVCIHGDGSDAVAAAMAVVDAYRQAGVGIRPFRSHAGRL